MIKGNFIDNLPKVYGIYTGGFLAFLIIMAIAEQMGMSAKAIGICFVAFTVAIYAIIGYLSRTAQADAYYVAGRQVPTVLMEWQQQQTGCLVHLSWPWLVVFTLKVMVIWLCLLDGLEDMY